MMFVVHMTQYRGEMSSQSAMHPVIVLCRWVYWTGTRWPLWNRFNCRCGSSRYWNCEGRLVMWCVMTADRWAWVEDPSGEDGERSHEARLQGQTGSDGAAIQPEDSELLYK